MKKTLILCCILSLFLARCRKSDSAPGINSLPEYSSFAEVKKHLMVSVISMAHDNPKFKETVESECLKAVRGEYNVALDRLIEIDKVSPIFTTKYRSSFISLARQMKKFKPNAKEMPILYLPVMEDKDPRWKKHRERNVESSIPIEKSTTVLPSNPNNYIIMVDGADSVAQSSVSRNTRIMLPPDHEDCLEPDYYPV